MSRALLSLLILIAFAAGASNASAASNDPWSASGPTATMTADGKGATFKYSVAGRSGAWTMQATGQYAHKVSVPWHYTGYHAYFGVKVELQKFLIRDGSEIVTETLESDSAARCCAAPSGGFDYSGTTEFDVKTGDVYGFRMSGSNADSDARLMGTLRLDVGDLTLPIATPRLSGVRGDNGWWRSGVRVSWDVSDPDSPVGTSVSCESRTVGWNTAGFDAHCGARSDAGYLLSSVTIKIDTVAPAITLRGPDTENGLVIHSRAGQPSSYLFDATDTTSGLAAPVACTVEGQPVPAHSSIFPLKGEGVCTASDKAGNSSKAYFLVIS